MVARTGRVTYSRLALLLMVAGALALCSGNRPLTMAGAALLGLGRRGRRAARARRAHRDPWGRRGHRARRGQRAEQRGRRGWAAVRRRRHRAGRRLARRLPRPARCRGRRPGTADPAALPRRSGRLPTAIRPSPARSTGPPTMDRSSASGATCSWPSASSSASSSGRPRPSSTGTAREQAWRRPWRGSFVLGMAAVRAGSARLLAGRDPERVTAASALVAMAGFAAFWAGPDLIVAADRAGRPRRGRRAAVPGDGGPRRGRLAGTAGRRRRASGPGQRAGRRRGSAGARRRWPRSLACARRTCWCPRCSVCSSAGPPATLCGDEHRRDDGRGATGRCRGSHPGGREPSTR